MNEGWCEILADPARLRAADGADFLGKLAAFPELLRTALEEAAPTPPPTLSNPARLVLGGMGGSAVAGSILAGLLPARGRLPLLLVRDYRLPYCDDEDLLILCSYSGNTEETLALLDEARRRSLATVLMSSGGALAEAAGPAMPLLSLPGDLPPRAALPAMLGRLIALLRGLDEPWRRAAAWDDGALLSALEQTASLCDPGQPVADNPAKALALAIGEERPVWVAMAPALEGVALRLRSQFEENAKRSASDRSLPELHHNSWIPWLGEDPPGLAVWMGEALAHPRVRLRRRMSEAALAARGRRSLELSSRGTEDIAHVLTSVLLGDFISAYHALMRGVDPTPTLALDAMKREMAALEEGP